MSPLLEATLKSVATAAVTTGMTFIATHGLPTTMQGWFGVIGAVLAAEAALFTQATTITTSPTITPTK